MGVLVGLAAPVAAALVATTVGAPPGLAAEAASSDVVNLSVVEPDPDAPDDQIGRWRVIQSGDQEYELRWTSPADLPVTDDRPAMLEGSDPLGVPEVSSDGRTVSLVVTAATAPDPDDLDVVLSGRVLDSTEQAPTAVESSPYVEPRGTTALAEDPGDPGDLETATWDYDLARTKIRGMPAKVEMKGWVVQPETIQADAPLVVFLHGRHSPCYGEPDPGAPWRDWPCPRGMTPVPSHLGYQYIQELLASQGYVTVSISANGINAQDYRLSDGGAGARATLIRRHLEQWVAQGWDVQNGVDIRNVILVGHSRGGEGANRASLETPLAADYRIRGQVLIGPTNFARQAAAYVPTATLLPFCDGDVVDLQGQSFTDVARDLAADDTALHSSLMVMGANHNYFNTEWTPGISEAPSFDDWGGDRDATCGTRSDSRLTAAEQRKVGMAYVAGAVRLMADGDEAMLGLFDGSPVTLASTGNADVRSHLVGGGRELRRPGVDAVLGPAAGAVTQLCAGKTKQGPGATLCGRRDNEVRTPHWSGGQYFRLPARKAFEMTWDARRERGGLSFTEPLDLSSATSLDLRTVVDPALGSVRLGVRLHDANGQSSVLEPVGNGLLPAFPSDADPALAKKWAQTLRVPLSTVSDVDLSAVTGIDLVGRSADGRVWVLDAAAALGGLVDVPAKRLARVNLGTGTVTEGDGPGEHAVDVPYTIQGTVENSARFTVVGYSWEGLEAGPIRVDVAPGQRSGTFEVPYEADSRDDVDVQRLTLAAFATRGAMTRDYVGSARITDDDPSPRVRISRLDAAITEGHRAKWRVRLSRPVDYYLSVRARFVAGDVNAPRLRVHDVPRRFLRDRVYPMPDPDRRLHKVEVWMGSYFEPGQRSAVIELPVRRDRRAEGREAVTLRVRLPGLSDGVARTVYVRDRN